MKVLSNSLHFQLMKTYSLINFMKVRLKERIELTEDKFPERTGLINQMKQDDKSFDFICKMLNEMENQLQNSFLDNNRLHTLYLDKYFYIKSLTDEKIQESIQEDYKEIKIGNTMWKIVS